MVVSAFTAIVVVTPHKASSLSEFTYDFGNAMFGLSSILLFTVGLKLLIIRQHLTKSYAKVVTWLAIGVLTEALLVGSSIIVKAIGLEPRSLGSLQDLLLLTTLPFIRAGYLFYQLTADTRTIDTQKNASAIDAVSYVASLASNVQDIDPILDGLRSVTSRAQPGQPLSDEDQKKLCGVYLQLESYLEHREQQRKFTRDQLRSLLHQKFNSPTSPSPDKTFWQQLPPLT